MKASDLRKSILQYAIEGKLVPQDENDEVAEILYKKIQKEKKELIKQGKIKKDKPLPPINDEDMPYNIPNSWKWVRLGEVCEIKRGNGLTKNDFTANGMPCIHYGQIHKYYKYYTNTTMTYTSEKVANKLKTVDYLDIIMAITSENIEDVCKSIAWLGNYSIVTGGHTAIIKHKLNPLYLVYLFNSNCFQIQKNKIAKGIKVIEVSSEKLKNILIPLPPLAEQERIVKKVDELMAICKKLEQEEKKLKDLDKNFIETLPKSILQYAVEGKLVPQNENDEVAEVLYKKIQKEKEELIKQGKIQKDKPLPPINDEDMPYNIPDSWKWVRLGEVVSIIQGTSYNKSDITSNKQDIRIIRGGNIKNYNINLLDDDIYIKQTNYNMEKQIYKNDIVIVASTGSKTILGNASFAYINYINSQIGAFLRIIRPYMKIVFPYLKIIFMTKYYMDYIKINSNGIGINNIKNNTINNLLIPLPPLAEQERIVKKVDELMIYCNKLRDSI